PILATRKPPGRTLSAATPPARKVSGFVGASQACANSPTVTFFDKHTRSQGPSLHRHYPASSVSGRRRRARLLSRWPPSAAQLGRGLARRLWPRCLSTKPRLQPPPRRTQRADFPHCAPPFASRLGLWDLSCWGDFRLCLLHRSQPRPCRS